MSDDDFDKLTDHLKAAVRILENNRGSLTVMQLRILALVKPALVDLVLHGSASPYREPGRAVSGADSDRSRTPDRPAGQ